MALVDLMELAVAKDNKKIGLSEARIKEQIPVLRQYIAYWREYPDMFVDFLCVFVFVAFKLTKTYRSRHNGKRI